MNFIKTIISDKVFIKKSIAIAIPVAFQNLLSSLLNLADTLMIGQLGETQVAAVGLANKLFFVFSLLIFGICSGSSILASQYFGGRELLNIKRVLRISLYLGVGGSLLFVIPGLLFPEFVMKIFTPQEGTIVIGASYLVIIALSYPVTAISNVYMAILRSMNYVKLPVVITLIAIGVNVVLNYIFIFGKFGFPVLGAAGAALATLIARIVEVAVLLIIVYLHKPGDDGIGDFIHNKYHRGKQDPFFLNKIFLMKYLFTAAPVIANEFMWGLGVTMYALVYGRMGDGATAAITITGTVENVINVFFFGLCYAAAVVLGNEMGANRLKQADRYAKNYIVVMFFLTIIGSGITLLLREPIISLFAVSDQVRGYIKLCLNIFAIFLPIRMMNALFIISILRSGGDTKVALFIDISSVWLIGIPMAIIGGMLLKLPVYLVYAMIMLEEVYKVVLGYLRYRKKKWLKNIVED